MMMKRLMVSCFWSLLLLPNIIYPMVSRGQAVPTAEKRELAEFPTLSPDNLETYPRDVERYINDHAAFRDNFLSLNAALNLELFDYADSADVIKGKEGWYFYAAGHCIQDALGIGRFTPSELESLTNRLQETSDAYRSKGIDFIAVFPPDKRDVYREYMPSCYQPVTPQNRAGELIEFIRQNSDVTVVDPTEYLNANRDYIWYLKTDTHWNDAAAFVTGQMVIEALGGEAVPIEAVEVVYEPVWPGDLAGLFHMPGRYSDDQAAQIKGYFDDAPIEYWDENEDNLIVHMNAPEAPDPRRVAFFRDSFGLAVMNTLPKYFRNMDFYYWNSFKPELLQENPPDVVVYEVVQRDIGRMVDDMERLAPKDGA